MNEIEPYVFLTIYRSGRIMLGGETLAGHELDYGAREKMITVPLRIMKRILEAHGADDGEKGHD